MRDRAIVFIFNSGRVGICRPSRQGRLVMRAYRKFSHWTAAQLISVIAATPPDEQGNLSICEYFDWEGTL